VIFRYIFGTQAELVDVLFFMDYKKMLPREIHINFNFDVNI
jgi:hypothetical protein